MRLMGSADARPATGSVRAVFDGRLIERGSADYEAARVDAIFNSRRPARFPGAVLEAATEADVVTGVRLARDRDWRVTVRSGGHSWVGLEPARRRPPDRPSGLREMAIASPGSGDGQPVDPRRCRAQPVHPVARLSVPRRALPDRRVGRLPAPGRSGVERPPVGMGVRERAGGRRRHRRRRTGARQRRLPSRSVLGGPRCWSRVLRCGHALPPEAVRPPAGVRADRVRAADRPFRRRVALGARRAPDARPSGRAGHRRHARASRRRRHRRRADDDHARHRPVRLAGRGRSPDAAVAGLPGARRTRTCASSRRPSRSTSSARSKRR